MTFKYQVGDRVYQVRHPGSEYTVVKIWIDGLSRNNYEIHSVLGDGRSIVLENAISLSATKSNLIYIIVAVIAFILIS